MRKPYLSLLGMLLLAVPALGSAHAFPDNSLPHVGATLTRAPLQVQVWFDGRIEPGASTLTVTNGQGQQVSQGQGEVARDNPKLLHTALAPALAAGTYTVHWSVVSHDGHHSAGRFDFIVK